jgi:hypothetical protein
MLTNRLFNVYKAVFEQGLTYEPWKHSATVVLRKPGKPKYDAPKAYRTVANCDTLGACSLHMLRG